MRRGAGWAQSHNQIPTQRLLKEYVLCCVIMQMSRPGVKPGAVSVPVIVRRGSRPLEAGLLEQIQSSIAAAVTTNHTAANVDSSSADGFAMSRKHADGGESGSMLHPSVATATDRVKAIPLAEKSSRGAGASADEQNLVHRKRMTELDAMRKLLEARATEVEGAHASLDKERRKLHSEYEAKISELTDAKARLEKQVAKMESKESQLRLEWTRFEVEKAGSIAEAEV